MKTNKLIHLIAGFMLAALAGGASADDTDIYLNPGSGLPPGSEPMVMFSLDYRPNLGAVVCQGTECDELIRLGYLPSTGPYYFFDLLRAVLRRVFDPLEDVRVGLMLNHDNTAGCDGPNNKKCSNGGYIAMGFELFEKGDGNGAKAKFHKILASMPTPLGGQSHSYQGKELFFEFFRYLTGQDIWNGHNGWGDYFTDNTQNADLDAAGYAWDPTIEEPGGQEYISPFSATGQCSNIYTVNLMFFVANQEDGADTEMKKPVSDGGFDASYRDFTGVIRYLNDADLGSGDYGDIPKIDDSPSVTSYFIVDPNAVNRTTIGYAQAGNTGLPLELSTDPEELQRTLENIFQQVLSVSTTFVAASVPVNVFNRAEVVDNVFLALFQVDEDVKPSWVGNLKKLRLADLDEFTYLADALGQPAVAADGRINFDALTYWTLPGQLPAADPTKAEVDGRDGRVVDRGGAGQRIPGFLSGSPGLLNGLFGNRRVYYDDGNNLDDLNADLTTALNLITDFNALTDAETLELIAYARGLDVDDLDGDGSIADARPWIFGDPLHSRPLPINYGEIGGYTQTNPAIFLAVSGNDGMLHFIRNTTTAGTQSGQEVWAFMPRSTMGVTKILRANGVGVPHPYGLDGSPAVYIEDTNANGSIDAGERAYLFVGMRRGGHAYYGLDITDPESPSLLWKIEKDAGDFAELGYTFSTPRVGHVNLGSGSQPVVIFGGGYDMNKDDRTMPGTDDGEGNAIYVVDAETGALIWKAVGTNGNPGANDFQHALLVDSIPSAMTVVDTDGDLLIDRIVTGDTGGNVWRADLTGTNPGNWKLTQLAQLGRHQSGGKSEDRRFFHRPDFVQSEDQYGQYDAVIIGSGDRTDPLDQGGVVDNFFYVVKDRNIASGAGADVMIPHGDLGDVTDNCLQESGSCSVDLTYGWRMALEDTGEKVLATPLTIDGKVFFTSYLPANAGAAPSCQPAEGGGRLYALGLQDARAVLNYDSTDDNPNYEGEATSKSDRSTDLSSPGIPAEVVSIPPNQILRPDLQINRVDVTTRWRTFWYLEEDSDL